ncbi:MAG: ABC transporter substrate-binding protein, partial [Bacteriovoracaceae bacterium]|nr:ABC transporter substrate-binding protein [Bacteriovoracaceae bacterium]
MAQGQDAHKAIVSSLIYLLKDKQLFSEINQSEYKAQLMDSFRKLSSSERVFLLERNDEKEAVIIPYLAAEEALQRYYFGDRAGAEDVLEWLENKFGNFEDVQSFVSEFQYRIENFAKVDVGAIGVVLPLSGDKERFGKKALMGIDTALNQNDNQLLSVKLYTRDNKNNSTVARKLVHDLIQKHHVSVIIGGLFPSTAKEEYLEARKYGALFISLSPVYLDKEEKNHLLIEIPGSVQSQVAAIFSDEFLAKNGNNIAMIYPDSEGGLAYVNEVWRKSNEGKINIKSLASYDKNVKDYREWVQKLLGLKYTSERSEEFDLWKEIYSLEKKNSSIRRIQTLKPVVDFDWVFAPSYPHEALQIIPSFTYFDAKGLMYVGGPSWMSRKLVKEQRNLGALRFVGDDPKDFDRSFMKTFADRNNARPALVETLAYEGMNLALSVVEGTKFEKREELERKLVNLEKIKGITGQWYLEEGVWLKELDILKINIGGKDILAKAKVTKKQPENIILV